MARYECIVCGWIYDEAEGLPDSGIAAGTLWADIPADWICPDCGVGKEDFQLIEEAVVEAAPHHARSEINLEAAPVVIIGSGLAGYSLVKEFRKHDKDTPVVVITADDGRAYSKPMLSTGFTKGKDADGLVQGDAGTMAKQLQAKVWTMTRVTSIDTAQQCIKLGEDEAVLHYRKLVLALGADTITPPLEGDARDYVYSINDLMDYADFRQAIARNDVKKVCIIGAGLIGCEFTNDLLNGGFAVEAVDATGAGDCFAGALMARLSMDEELVAAVTYACAAAALTCTDFGAVDPLPRSAEVLNLIATRHHGLSAAGGEH